VFVDMPRGFSQQGKCLKLKKSIYGLRQSPRNFFQHLKGKLESAGLVSNSELDPCLFLSDEVICLVYVDNTLFFLPKAEYIDEIIQRLRDNDMELEEESSVGGFLGVNMTYDKVENTVKLTQEGLTKRIIEALNIKHMPQKLTPATHEPLVKDSDGDPPNGVKLFKCDWHVAIPTRRFTSRYNIRSFAVCKIHTLAEAIARARTSANRTVFEGYNPGWIDNETLTKS
jgi:hypothetical protein